MYRWQTPRYLVLLEEFMFVHLVKKSPLLPPYPQTHSIGHCNVLFMSS